MEIYFQTRSYVREELFVHFMTELIDLLNRLFVL